MKYYTVTQVAKEFGFTRQAVINWIKKGKISCIKIMREYRIPESEIERIKDGKTGAVQTRGAGVMNNKMNELIDIELKPCPFCAGKAVLFEEFMPTWVACKKCRASTEAKYDVNEAIQAWNRRTDNETD